MALYGSNPLKRSPILQILIPFSIGILYQYYLSMPQWLVIILIPVSLTGLLIFHRIPVLARFRHSMLSGIFTAILFFSLGAALCRNQDIRLQDNWYGHQLRDTSSLLLVLEERLVEKSKSFKAIAAVRASINNNQAQAVNGRLLIYFSKDSTVQSLDYGSRLIIRQPVREIKSAGNPGAFDFKQYSLFQGITHQVYLRPVDYEVLPGKEQNWFRKQLFISGQFLVQLLKRYIPGRLESGIAEALLIGYKQDLDPEIVQSYSNTGVVHIIAISGLHLGLIYWLLLLLLKPLNQSKKTRWLHATLVITGLWTFSFLAGAQPSVLRSALMFSCMVLGNSVNRKSPAINSLAVSAFILLCYNPFWLWDAGFQLSYAAVLSILLFNQPVYNWFYVKNKLLDYAWKMNAVTIAAQILTLPVSLYLFHQFPVSFLFSNFIAVPLSSLLLLGEIFLCLIAFYPALAGFTGKLIASGIRLMNAWIERVEQLPFSVWEGIQLSSTQAIWLTGLLLTASYWLMEKSKKAFGASLFFLLLFSAERFISFREATGQQKIIVYHVPRLQAIDFIQRRKFWFTGDSSFLQNQQSRNFHLKPSRVLHRVTETDRLNGLLHYEYYYRFGGKNILCLDSGIYFEKQADSSRPVIDLLVLSGNPKLYLNRLAEALDIRQLVIDGSVPAWKASLWKKDADSLQIPFYNTGEKGAFVMSLN